MSPDAVRRCLSLTPAEARGDQDLNSDAAHLRKATLTPAAVLIPIIQHAQAATVLFTQRAADLRRHAGQVSFPGGKIDAGDADDIAAALREAEEEINVPRHAVDVIGRLGSYETGTGFLIKPVVGLLASGQVFVPQVAEVASVFEVPLAYLIDPQNIKRHSRDWGSGQRHFYGITYKDHYIWGATAGMLVQLAGQLGSDIHAIT
jgi:8-oxo-dGTP pyrophosphatase MutT (NUDIX family)